MTRRSTVFLSYARRQPDESWAARLVASMTARFALTVLFDKRAIRVGHDFRTEIARGIAEADAMIFLGSTSSLTSPYCLDECRSCRAAGKPLVPLFIEAVDWSGFPEEFHALHFEQLFRAGADDGELAARAGRALLAAGIDIDPASVPPLATAFDAWAGNIHPPYPRLRGADGASLRAYVDDCAAKLALRPEQGYHNLNLALLHLALGDAPRALPHAERALADLPGRADAYYFTGLVTAAQSPLLLAPKARIEAIVRLTDQAMALGEAAAGAPSAGFAGLPLVLRAAVAYEYYARNGFISRCGEPADLIAEARRRGCSPGEVDRLLDALDTSLSPASRQLMATAASP